MAGSRHIRHCRGYEDVGDSGETGRCPDRWDGVEADYAVVRSYLLRSGRERWFSPRSLSSEVISINRVKSDGHGLVILVPMLGRPHRVNPLLESIRAVTPAAKVLFMLTMNDGDVRRAVIESGSSFHEMAFRQTGDYATKINTGVSLTTEPLIFTAADDLKFHLGWFEAALAALTPGIGVVGTNDLGNPRVMAGQHATHFLVTREYAQLGTIDQPNSGMIFSPQYPHEFIDDELIGTARYRRAWAMAIDAHVEHLHPNWGKGQLDGLYLQQRRRMQIGRTIYERRRHLWE